MKKECFKIRRFLKKQETCNRINAQKIDKHHAVILEEADRLQREMNQSAEVIREGQEKTAALIYDMMKDMYQMEVEPVAEVYLQLYKMVKTAGDHPEDSERFLSNLRVLLRCFEKSLSGLGLVTYYPETGSGCLCPGIKKVSAGGEEILVRPVVKTEGEVRA